MKKILMIALILTQSFAANAMVLPAGSPRPQERAILTVQNASGIYQGVQSAALTRVSYEQTSQEGFVLELGRGGRTQQIEFHVTNKRQGQCGEMIYIGQMRSQYIQFAQGGPTIIVTDHRSNICPTLIALPAWAVSVQNGMMAHDFINLVGDPEPIFTIQSVRGF